MRRLSVMTLDAVTLSVLIVTVDNRLGAEWMRDFTWLYANQPDGARAVLSTVEGSIITVAGVTGPICELACETARSVIENGETSTA